MSNFNIIKADKKHCKRIWEWRNDPLTLKMSINQNIISFEDHILWFEKILLDKSKSLYLGEESKVLIGVIRFEQSNINKDIHDISLNIAPSMRGKGLGKKLLIHGIEAFKKEERPCRYFRAVIKKENTRSQKLFKSCGFYNYISKDYIAYRYDLYHPEN